MTTQERDPNIEDGTPVAPDGHSQGQGAPISGDAQLLDSILNNPDAVSKLTTALLRERQSEKDKRIARMEKEIQDLKGEKEDAPVTETPASAQVTKQEVSIGQALRNTGIDGSDKLAYEATKKVREGISQNELEMWLIEQRHVQQPPASPASATQTGGSVGSPTNAADIQRRIDAIQADRNKMLSKEGRAELNTLTAELDTLTNTA